MQIGAQLCRQRVAIADDQRQCLGCREQLFGGDKAVEGRDRKKCEGLVHVAQIGPHEPVTHEIDRDRRVVAHPAVEQNLKLVKLFRELGQPAE